VEGRQLLPQRQVFQNQLPVAAERQRECADDHDQQFQHAVDRGWRWGEIQTRTSFGDGHPLWVTVTLAPGTTPPDSSNTRPVMAPCSTCA
jgi:hypothetical protein